MNKLLKIKIRNIKSGEVFGLTGFLSRSDDVVVEFGAKDEKGCYIHKSIDDKDFQDFEIIKGFIV